MKYMLLMWGDETDPDGKAAARVCEAGWLPWVSEMQKRGVLLHGGGMLASPSDSATVRRGKHTGSVPGLARPRRGGCRADFRC